MKQAVKETETVQALPLETAAEPGSLKTEQSEEARLQALNKTNLFNRFLEANSDCV